MPPVPYTWPVALDAVLITVLVSMRPQIGYGGVGQCAGVFDVFWKRLRASHTKMEVMDHSAAH